MKLKSPKKISLIFSSLIVLIFLIVLANHKFLENYFTKGVLYYSFPAILFLAFVIEIVPTIFNPSAPAILGIILGLNIHLLVIVTLIGSLMGSVLGYFFGKKYGIDSIDAVLDDKTAKKTERFIREYGRFFILLAAITPLPYFPLVIGALNMPKKEFLFYGILPRLAGLAILLYAVFQGFIIL